MKPIKVRGYHSEQEFIEANTPPPAPTLKDLSIADLNVVFERAGSYLPELRSAAWLELVRRLNQLNSTL